MALLIKSFRALSFPSVYLSYLVPFLLLPFPPPSLFSFPLLSLSSSSSSPSFSSLLIYPLAEGKIEFPFSKWSIWPICPSLCRAAPQQHALQAHPACFKGEHVHLPNCTTLYENGGSISFLPVPGPDALNSPSHLFSVAFNVVMSPEIIQSWYLS